MYGIPTNIVFLLYTIGWEPAQCARWIQPGGIVWTMPPTGFPTLHIVYAIQDTISMQLCSKASQFHNGKGLESGLAWPESMKVIRAHKKSDPRFSYGLESLMCACEWSPRRVALAFPKLPVVSCQCGEDSPDDMHQKWTCPLLL